jgi:ABC-type phosphate/phosphonate transport system substrate-binding protein
VPANAPFGHCPKCLLDLGFGPLPDKTEDFSSVESSGTRVFGEYELIEQIGRGGMGVVYKARQVALNRPVALKMISAGEFASPVVIQRFHREAEAAANLHHPNIIPIYETGEIQGQHYLSMALIDGVGLDEYIKGAGSEVGLPGKGARSVSRMRQEEIARLLAKVARAVDHAHQHGVLHRDLKPSNILVDPNGEPHLTDFGLAKVLGRGDSSLTVTGAIMGTPSFMAPEQAAGGSKSTSTAADVYSLGAILYAMLTGVPPFRGDTPVETLRQVVEQEPKPPSTLREGIDSDLATIAMKCLEKEPQRRYPSAAALAEDLERWSRKEPIQARPTHTTERFWRWCRRNPRVAVLSGAVALLLVLLTLGSTIAAVMFAAQHEVIRQEVAQSLVDVIDKRKPFYDVSSPMRRALTSGLLSALKRKAIGEETKPTSTPRLELTIALYPYRHPTNMLETFSPILDALEDRLTHRLNRPTSISLRMFDSYRPVHQAVESNDLTFARMGPASYLDLLERGGIDLLAMQDHKTPLSLAIFTHKENETARRYRANTNTPLVELIKNTRLALGDTNSTTGYHVACRYFADNGIFATNFASYSHLSSQQRVINAIRERNADVGVGNLDLVDEDPELLIIAKYPLPGDLGLCWVANKRLDPTIARHLQDCLLEIKDPAILGKLESEVLGFKTLDQKAVEWLIDETTHHKKPFFNRPQP